MAIVFVRQNFFTALLQKVSEKNLRAFGGFYLLPATVRLAQPSTLWQGTEVQNRKPTLTVSRFSRASPGSNPTPNGDSVPPASVVSTVAGLASSEPAALRHFWGYVSRSVIGTETIRKRRLVKVRNSERRFCLSGSKSSGKKEEDFNGQQIF